MNKQVFYRGLVLAKASTALELWNLWQKETKDKNAARKKLDKHIDLVNANHLRMHGQMPEWMNNFKIGEHTEVENV